MSQQSRRVVSAVLAAGLAYEALHAPQPHVEPAEYHPDHVSRAAVQSTASFQGYLVLGDIFRRHG